MELSITLPPGPDQLDVVGASERNLKLIRESLGVHVASRNGVVHISGKSPAVSQAAAMLETLSTAARHGAPLTRQQLLSELSHLQDDDIPASAPGAALRRESSRRRGLDQTTAKLPPGGRRGFGTGTASTELGASQRGTGPTGAVGSSSPAGSASASASASAASLSDAADVGGAAHVGNAAHVGGATNVGGAANVGGTPGSGDPARPGSASGAGAAAGSPIARVGEPLDVYLPHRRIAARTEGQAAYISAMQQHDLTFCCGPAGTGKTYLAVAMAVNLLKRGQYRKLVLVRPAVEAGEKLGYLPGDMQEKVNPYLRPLLDALHDMMPFDQVGQLMANDVIEIVPLAFMRGRTLNDGIIIMDEAQNTTHAQMLMFLTRLGQRGKMIVTGDTSQVDLPDPRQSGLIDAVRRLRRVPGVAFVTLDRQDIVRHPLVQRIVQAYRPEDESKATRAEPPPPNGSDAQQANP